MPEPEVALLWYVSSFDNNQVSVEDEMFSREPFDVAFASLLQNKYLTMVGLNVMLTELGKNAIDSGITIRYPMVQRGSASDYNKTLLSMSTGAANALIESMIRVGQAFFDQLEPKRLGRFVSSLFSGSQVRKIPFVNTASVYFRTRESLQYGLSKQPLATTYAVVCDEIASFGQLLHESIKSYLVESYQGGVSFNAIHLSTLDGRLKQISGLKVDDELIYVESVLTDGSKESIPLECFAPQDIKQMIALALG